MNINSTTTRDWKLMLLTIITQFLEFWLLLKNHKVREKKRHFQKLTIKWFTFFVLSSWNFVKIISSCGIHFHQVLWESVVYRRPKVYGRSRRFLTFGYGYGCRRSIGPKAKVLTDLVEPWKTKKNTCDKPLRLATLESVWYFQPYSQISNVCLT